MLKDGFDYLTTIMIKAIECVNKIISNLLKRSKVMHFD